MPPPVPASPKATRFSAAAAVVRLLPSAQRSACHCITSLQLSWHHRATLGHTEEIGTVWRNMRGSDGNVVAARLSCAGSVLLLLKPSCRSCDRFGIGTAGERVTRCAAVCRCHCAAFPVGFEQWLPPDRCSDTILCDWSGALGTNPYPCSCFVGKGLTADFSLSAAALETGGCLRDSARAAGGVAVIVASSCVLYAGHHCARTRRASQARRLHASDAAKSPFCCRAPPAPGHPPLPTDIAPVFSARPCPLGNFGFDQTCNSLTSPRCTCCKPVCPFPTSHPFAAAACRVRRRLLQQQFKPRHPGSCHQFGRTDMTAGMAGSLGVETTKQSRFRRVGSGTEVARRGGRSRDPHAIMVLSEALQDVSRELAQLRQVPSTL